MEVGSFSECVCVSVCVTRPPHFPKEDNQQRALWVDDRLLVQSFCPNYAQPLISNVVIMNQAAVATINCKDLLLTEVKRLTTLLFNARTLTTCICVEAYPEI